MNTLKKASIITFSIFIILLLNNFAKNPKSTLLVTQPAVSQNHLCFSYANDLWISNLDGSYPRRLTTAPGQETDPFFSPDGKMIAFSGNYDGNTDVFMVPTKGGTPERITYHPYADTVRGFSQNGQKIIFSSAREAYARYRSKLYAVSIKGGYPIALEIPFANKGSFSPDGKFLAYTPWGEVYNQWKNYRGGTHTQIWIYSFKTKDIKKIPQPAGRCNDTDPFWVGDKIYFRSDKNGEFNLFSYNINSKKLNQHTSYQDFPVLDLYASQDKLVYEQAGLIHNFDFKSKESKIIPIQISTDLREIRSRYTSSSRFVHSIDISPSGARGVLGYRGEIITIPAKKGDPRNITDTVSIHERFPTWSPDGKKIACFSDQGGEYQLMIYPQDKKGKSKTYTLPGAGFYANLTWSSDNKKISFTDNSRTLFWIDLVTGKVKKIAQEILYSPGTYSNFWGVWSPDSNWIFYSLANEAEFDRIFAYSLKTGRVFTLTDGLSDTTQPVFDPKGKYLYFLASTDAGPRKHWFDMSNNDTQISYSIYIATLQRETLNPLAKESDEESPKIKKKEEKKDQDKKPADMKIDFKGFDQRILALPIEQGRITNLRAGDDEKIYYLLFPKPRGGGELHCYDLKKRKDENLGSGINFFEISDNYKKILYRKDRNYYISDLGKLKPGKGMLNLSKVSVKIDPKAEWRQIFNEAWRVNRDYFYDPNMHGVNWNDMRKKYQSFIPHLSCRADLNRVVQWMCSELAVGHHRGGGGDFLDRPLRIPGGLLGADYTIYKNRYQFKKIYGGLNWTPDLRSPLTEPGLNIKEGDFLLKVNGKELSYPDNIFKYFENTSNKIVAITISSNINGTDARILKAVPLENEYSLRNRAWVENNINYVTKATNGRCAYVYVPNTAGMGQIYFKRYFFPQSNRDAIIIDERFNGGGQVADYYIDILKRSYICNWATRYGKTQRSPSAMIQGPKVMLINEMAGSGGDLLPYMFRKAKLGKLIGTRTWGGLVGVLGFPVLMDGAYLTAPNLGFWTPEEGFAVENEGVAPDIKVEQTPKEMLKGKDPQLERAITEILKALKKNPPKKRTQPPFPIRVKKS